MRLPMPLNSLPADIAAVRQILVRHRRARLDELQLQRHRQPFAKGARLDAEEKFSSWHVSHDSGSIFGAWQCVSYLRPSASARSLSATF